jgi:hypothetical protein
VGVEGPGGDAGRRGYPLDPPALVAVATELGHRRVDELLACLGLAFLPPHAVDF